MAFFACKERLQVTFILAIQRASRWVHLTRIFKRSILANMHVENPRCDCRVWCKNSKWKCIIAFVPCYVADTDSVTSHDIVVLYGVYHTFNETSKNVQHRVPHPCPVCTLFCFIMVSRITLFPTIDLDMILIMLNHPWLLFAHCWRCRSWPLLEAKLDLFSGKKK